MRSSVAQMGEGNLALRSQGTFEISPGLLDHRSSRATLHCPQLAHRDAGMVFFHLAEIFTQGLGLSSASGHAFDGPFVVK